MQISLDQHVQASDKSTLWWIFLLEYYIMWPGEGISKAPMSS